MELELANFRLRPLELEDKEIIAQLGNDFDIWKNLRDLFPHPYELADAVRFISRVSQSENPEQVFAIVEGEQLVGVIGLYPQDDVHRGTAELGYWLGRPFWGKGIGTAAVKRIVQYGFEELQLRRIFADIYATNPASMRVVEKAGFELEGIRRLAILKNGEIQDDHLYAILNPRFL